MTRGIYICTFVVEASDEWEQMFSKGSKQLDATRYTAYVLRPAAPPRHHIHRLTQIDSTEKNTIMFAGRSLLTNRHIINSIPLCVVREEVCCTRSLCTGPLCFHCEIAKHLQLLPETSAAFHRTRRLCGIDVCGCCVTLILWLRLAREKRQTDAECRSSYVMSGWWINN